MESFKNYIVELAAKQGLSFMMMLGLTIYFYFQVEQIKVEFRACNSENKELYKNYAAEMKEIILRNTAVFERIENKIK